MRLRPLRSAELNLAKSTDHRLYRLRCNLGRGIRRLDDQTTPATASPDRRDKKPCLGIHGSRCHDFGAGAWAADLERQHLVQRARGRSDYAIGANPPTRPDAAPIRAGHSPSSGDAATVCRTENCRSVPRPSGRCPPRQSVGIRTAPAARGFAACLETRKPARPMVAGTGYDACRQDRRHTLAVGPAGRAGNSKSVRRSPGLLADLTVRQFWSVRAAQRYISGHTDAMRTSCSRRRWNDSRIGERLRGADPYLPTADALRRQDAGSRIKRMRPISFMDGGVYPFHRILNEPRHAGTASLAGAQEYSAHGALHRARP